MTGDGVMPKETINDQSGMYDVQVGWQPSPTGSVQLGVESHDGRSIAEHLTGENETPANFTGLWGSLDRDGVNRLIRTLRRARDSAYGADA
ncbi:hypothetical protein OOJ91_12195 [Micromonospora lupini]|uniref:hypothetical protein n=1 Tax=Micromonospora lupini TaxID=285679 RepID=UPI002255CA54|nr:hypothetical protein [Micromonospora lupini]MCX5066639.1 hypothetical protein [Micromonospora lupini]